MSEILPPPNDTGLQPVRIDPKAYRQFVEGLNTELAKLEARFADRRTCESSRQHDVQPEHNANDLNLDDTTQQGPAL